MSHMSQINPMGTVERGANFAGILFHQENGRVYREGEHLFRMGDTLNGIFVVNSGVIKLYTISEGGEEHIVRFCTTGDLLGLEALTDRVSNTNAEVLDIANVSFQSLADIMSGDSEYDLVDFMDRIACTLQQETEHCRMMSRATAARRVAWFLCEYANKLSRRGMISDYFDVPMTRSEIGLYLGLAVETVSRELAKFAKNGIIKKQLKRIEIVDLAALQRLAVDES